jgi:hypothetical protein
VRLIPLQHQPTGIEVFCEDFSCYTFGFDAGSLRDWVIDLLSGWGVKIEKGVNRKELEELTKRWVAGQCSNFDYLIYLNRESGRSWNDFTQYPIMPWIIKDFVSDSIDLDNASIYRDLSLPIFAQTQEQHEQCLAYLEISKALGPDAHCTPNYVSNVGSTLYFLVRLEPFTDEEVKFQGGLDSAERTFQSFSIAWNVMTSGRSRNSLELVPEFFFSPYALQNVNEINFPDSARSNRIVGDVQCPPWASSSRDLVYKMRLALEGKFVSEHLHEWIDLIWGYRRRGNAARAKFNVFPSTVFEFNPREVMDDRSLFKAIRDQIHHCGEAPEALFKDPHPSRKGKDIFFAGSIQFRGTRRVTRFGLTVLEFSTAPDRWVPVAAAKTAFRAVRLVQGSIEGTRNGTTTEKLVVMADEFRVTCFDVKGAVLVTGHQFPLVTVWRLRDKVTLVDHLQCHLSPVCSVLIVRNLWSLLAAGHEDGSVSLFSGRPMRFIRLFSSPVPRPIGSLRINLATGDILVIQESIVSLWSVNGDRVASASMDANITDSLVTAYPEGTMDNFVFLLCADSRVFVMRGYDLEIASETKLPTPDPVALVYAHDTSGLAVSHADGSVTMLKII